MYTTLHTLKNTHAETHTHIYVIHQIHTHTQCSWPSRAHWPWKENQYFIFHVFRWLGERRHEELFAEVLHNTSCQVFCWGKTQAPRHANSLARYEAMTAGTCLRCRVAALNTKSRDRKASFWTTRPCIRQWNYCTIFHGQIQTCLSTALSWNSSLMTVGSYYIR